MLLPTPHLNLFKYLENYIQHHGYGPVIDEMMVAMKKSRGAIQNSLQYLERERYIERERGKARAMRILKPTQSGIPIWGTIAAGYLTEACTNGQDFLSLSGPNFQPDDFALQVDGDSMVNDGIADGAFVIMRPVSDSSLVKNGEIVAALVEGQGTTLKRFYRDGDQILLIAANPKYTPFRIDTKDCPVQIQGVLVSIWQMPRN